MSDIPKARELLLQLANEYPGSKVAQRVRDIVAAYLHRAPYTPGDRGKTRPRLDAKAARLAKGMRKRGAKYDAIQEVLERKVGVRYNIGRISEALNARP